MELIEVANIVRPSCYDCDFDFHLYNDRMRIKKKSSGTLVVVVAASN